MIESATRDGEIPAIFNPKRVRTPSVVVTGDSPNGPSPFSGVANIPQITHSDSLTSSQPGDGAESLTGIIIGDHLETQSQGSQQHHSLTQTTQNQVANSTSNDRLKPKGCKGRCCSELAQKVSQL
jgi:solute carrier family 35 protein F3/4